nr:hypothetical protein [Tanacetum cinerariifolium]
MSLFGQDDDTFTNTMFLNVDQLQKQLDKDELQEDGSMAAFWVINRQFQQLIDSKFTLDYDSQMADKTRHQRQYDRKVNKRQMQPQENKVDVGKALDANVVDTESIRTESTVQDESSRSGNNTNADDADIRPIYDEEPMTEVQLTAKCNIFAIGQQHTEQLEIIHEGKPVLQSLRNQSVVRQSNAFKSERPQMSKPQFASQVDVNKNLSRPVTQHYLPKRRESVFVKPNHMIAVAICWNYNPKGERFLIASRFPTPPLACAFFSPGATVTDCSCSKGNVEDKILVPKPPKTCARCAKCGHPVNGPYCQGYSLLREKLEEDLVTYLKYFQDTSESSDDSTNVVNAPREPFVVKQDQGVKSSQNPPHIDKCCCEYGDALDGIYCQQCI